MAIDCLTGYLHWLQQDGEETPPASSIEDIDSEAISVELSDISDDCFVHMVTVDVNEYVKAHFGNLSRKPSPVHHG